jgi:hypothetical protein
MISEYKLYHGAALWELISRCPKGVTIRSIAGEGRTSVYVIDDTKGLHLKHSTSRLRPWQFTFSRDAVDALVKMRRDLEHVFIALVCRTDGIVCLSLEEAISVLLPSESVQLWLRVDRRKHHHYSVSGPVGELRTKKPGGFDLAWLAPTRA